MMNDSGNEKLAGKFRIFRRSSSPDLAETGSLHREDMTPTMQTGLQNMYEAGLDKGHEVRVLFDAPGFSLIYSWFKSGYPLPLHSHDQDCLYYLIAGSVRLGTERLGPGDGFFVPRNAPYTYRPEANGAEILEFRHVGNFAIRFVSNNKAFWDKALKTVEMSREKWASEKRPLESP
jgi:quercetin dioxygenase-like cupin family protein